MRSGDSALLASTVSTLSFTSARPPETTQCIAVPSGRRASRTPGTSDVMKLMCSGRMPNSPSGPIAEASAASPSKTIPVGVTSLNGNVAAIFQIPKLLAAGQALGLFARVFNGADEVEGLLGQVVAFAVKDFGKAAHRVLALNVLAGLIGERLRDEHRLRQEALDAARASDDGFVLGRQFFHPEDGYYVLQVLVALENCLHAARDAVVLLADDLRIENSRSRAERIDSGENRLLENLAIERRDCVEVREGGRRRGVGQVVGRYVDGLHRCDRALLGGGDALFELAHVGAESRLITDGAGHAAEQCGDFGVGLHEAENVVDEEDDVLAFDVAEIFGDCHSRQRDAGARARRLVHLAVDQRGL